MRNTLALLVVILCWLAPPLVAAHRLRPDTRRATTGSRAAWPSLTPGRMAAVLALGQLLLTMVLWLASPRATATATFLPASWPDALCVAASWFAALAASLAVLAAARLVQRMSQRWPAIARAAAGVLVTWVVAVLALSALLGLVLAAHLAWSAREYRKQVPVVLDGGMRLHFMHAPSLPALDYGAHEADAWRAASIASESLPIDGGPAADVAAAAASLSSQTPLLSLRPARSDDALLDVCASSASPTCTGSRYVAEIGSPWPFIARTPAAFARECMRTIHGVLRGLPASLVRRDLDNATRFFAFDAEAAAHYVDRPAGAVVQTLVHRANPRQRHALNPFPALLVASWLPIALGAAWLLSLVHVKPVTVRRRGA